MIKVQKRDGRIVNYDREKIVRAIQKANAEVDAAERAGEALIDGILDDVERECEGCGSCREHSGYDREPPG